MEALASGYPTMATLSTMMPPMQPPQHQQQHVYYRTQQQQPQYQHQQQQYSSQYNQTTYKNTAPIVNVNSTIPTNRHEHMPGQHGHLANSIHRNNHVGVLLPNQPQQQQYPQPKGIQQGLGRNSVVAPGPPPPSTTTVSSSSPNIIPTVVNRISPSGLRRMVCDAIFDADPASALSDDRWFPLTDYSNGSLAKGDQLLANELHNVKKWKRKAKEWRTCFLMEHGLLKHAKRMTSSSSSSWLPFPVTQLTMSGATFPWKFNNSLHILKLLKRNRHNFIFEALICDEKNPDQRQLCVLKCCRLFNPEDVLQQYRQTQQQQQQYHHYQQPQSQYTTTAPLPQNGDNGPAGIVQANQQFSGVGNAAPMGVAYQRHSQYYPNNINNTNMYNNDANNRPYQHVNDPNMAMQHGNAEDRITALLHMTNETVFVAQPWMEIISWALLYPEYFYGHCNVRDPTTGAYYALLFIPRFHSTLLQLTRSTLQAHDSTTGQRIGGTSTQQQQKQHLQQRQQSQMPLNTSHAQGQTQADAMDGMTVRRQQQQNQSSTHPQQQNNIGGPAGIIQTYPQSTTEQHVPPHLNPSLVVRNAATQVAPPTNGVVSVPSVVVATHQLHWANILHAAITQIMFVTLAPFKERFRMCHNDFKSDNVAYIRTEKMWYYVNIRSNIDASPSIVLRIPTYGREFVLIDFGFTYLECAGDKYCSVSPVDSISTGMIFNNLYTDNAQLAYSLLREFLLMWANAYWTCVTSSNASSAHDKCGFDERWLEFIYFLRSVASTDQGNLITIDTQRWAEPMYAEVSAFCTDRKWDFLMPMFIERYGMRNGSSSSSSSASSLSSASLSKWIVPDEEALRDEDVVDFIWSNVDAFIAQSSSVSMGSQQHNTNKTTTSSIGTSSVSLPLAASVNVVDSTTTLENANSTMSSSVVDDTNARDNMVSNKLPKEIGVAEHRSTNTVIRAQQDDNNDRSTSIHDSHHTSYYTTRDDYSQGDMDMGVSNSESSCYNYDSSSKTTAYVAQSVADTSQQHEQKQYQYSNQGQLPSQLRRYHVQSASSSSPSSMNGVHNQYNHHNISTH